MVKDVSALTLREKKKKVKLELEEDFVPLFQTLVSKKVGERGRRAYTTVGGIFYFILTTYIFYFRCFYYVLNTCIIYFKSFYDVLNACTIYFKSFYYVLSACTFQRIVYLHVNLHRRGCQGS